MRYGFIFSCGMVSGQKPAKSLDFTVKYFFHMPSGFRDRARIWRNHFARSTDFLQLRPGDPHSTRAGSGWQHPTFLTHHHFFKHFLAADYGKCADGKSAQLSPAYARRIAFPPVILDEARRDRGRPRDLHFASSLSTYRSARFRQCTSTGCPLKKSRGPEAAHL